MTTQDIDEDVTVCVPDEFICPLTLDIFQQPLLTRHGHTFEGEVLLKWMDQNGGICPLTRRTLSLSDLILNRNLLARIRQWKRIHGVIDDKPVDRESGYFIAAVDGDDQNDHRFLTFYVSAKKYKRGVILAHKRRTRSHRDELRNKSDGFTPAA